jgi:hypothetical protein
MAERRESVIARPPRCGLYHGVDMLCEFFFQ